VTDAKVRRAALTHPRRDRPLRAPAHQRLLHELGWHHDRGRLGRFLDDPQLEPTNKRAERVLRPAVIARKVSPCAKNRRGTHTFEACTRVTRTLTQQGIDSRVEGLYDQCRFPSIQDVPLGAVVTIRPANQRQPSPKVPTIASTEMPERQSNQCFKKLVITTYGC
jgi:Transposase IS66 family